MTWTPVPILMYHAVENHPRPPQYKHFYVTLSQFRRQMNRLAQLGYQPVDLEQVVSAMAGGASLPEKPVVLTFDDGYANLLPNVDPIMLERHWPYTVFLVSDRVGGRNEWVVQGGYEPTELLGWRQIYEMHRNGCASFQPHTATHPNLSTISSELIRDELVRSRESLEQRIQLPMKTLCYPYGGYTDTVVDIAREAGYCQAVTTDFGRVRLGDDALRLPRISIYHVPPISLTYGPAGMNFDWRVQKRTDSRPVAAAAS